MSGLVYMDGAGVTGEGRRTRQSVFITSTLFSPVSDFHHLTYSLFPVICTLLISHLLFPLILHSHVKSALSL